MRDKILFLDMDGVVNSNSEIKKYLNDLVENQGYSEKEASKKYNEVTQGLNFSELEGSQRKEAKQYRYEMADAGAQKRRAVSDSIFYGRLAADEAYNMQDYTNLQALAYKMSQA